MNQRTVGLFEAVKLAIAKNYCRFSGRSSRSEFWWFNLFYGILMAIILILFFTTGSGFFGFLYIFTPLAFFLPTLGLCVRRLHDIGRSGWSLLFGLIPLVGGIILLIWYLKGSQETENAYGPVPNCN